MMSDISDKGGGGGNALLGSFRPHFLGLFSDYLYPLEPKRALD